MNVRLVPIKCTQCGQGNVKPKQFVVEHNNTTYNQYKWVCHRCGLLVKKHNEAK
jgi:ribosomal protein S27AE